MLATGVTVGLAEWIIDDTCPVEFVFVGKILLEKPFGIICFAKTYQLATKIFIRYVDISNY